MNDIITKLFPQGQRKLLVSLIALAIAIGFEKFTKQGLTEEMKTSLIAIVAIFTGGNVMEHLANALKVFKGTKAGELLEAVLPGDQGLGPDPQDPQKEEAPVYDATEDVRYLYQQVQQIQAAQAQQTANTQKILEIVNNRGPSVGPQRPPQA